MVCSSSATLRRRCVCFALLLLTAAVTACTDSPEVGDPDAFVDDATDALRGDAAALERDATAASASAEALGCWTSGQCPIVTCPCSSGPVATRGCHDGVCAGAEVCFGGPMSVCGEPAPDDAEPMRGLTGDPCTGHAQCASGICMGRSADASRGYCSQLCTSWADCPTGWLCGKVVETDATVCVLPEPH